MRKGVLRGERAGSEQTRNTCTLTYRHAHRHMQKHARIIIDAYLSACVLKRTHTHTKKTPEHVRIRTCMHDHTHAPFTRTQACLHACGCDGRYMHTSKQPAPPPNVRTHARTMPAQTKGHKNGDAIMHTMMAHTHTPHRACADKGAQKWEHGHGMHDGARACTHTHTSPCLHRQRGTKMGVPSWYA